MIPTLPAGRFFGRTVGSWRTAVGELSESVYEPDTALAAHAHARPYVCLTMHGGHRETSGTGVRECVPATVVVHPAGERHSNRFASAGGHLFRLELDETWIASKCGGFEAPAEIHGGPLAHLVGRIFREFRQPDDLSPLMVEALTLEFAAGALRDRRRESSRAAPQWLSRLREYLHAHYSGQIRLDDLARDAGIHPAHLNRAFRALHGCSIGEYTRRLRVDAAARLLTSSSTPIAEIAAVTGFADQSHLTRVFTRLTGLSPARYRALEKTGRGERI